MYAALFVQEDELISKLQVALDAVFKSLGRRGSIHIFKSGNSYINRTTAREYDIIFMEMSPFLKSGLDITSSLKKEQSSGKTYIFLIQNGTVQIPSSFYLTPFSIIPTAVDEKRLREHLCEVFNQAPAQASRQRKFYFESEKGKIKIPLDHIVYVEACGKYVKLVTQNNIYHLHSKFNDTIDTINSEEFIQTHRSYYVNSNHVSSVGRDSIVMENGHIIPVSRSFRSGVTLSF